MAINDADVAALKGYCDEVSTTESGGIDYARLKRLRLPGCTPDTVDALLCLGDRGEGYATRLYFSEKVTPPRVLQLNWNANGVRILEENWHAYSWKVPKGTSPVDTLIEHLKPLR